MTRSRSTSGTIAHELTLHREDELDLILAQPLPLEALARDVGPQHRSAGLHQVQQAAQSADTLTGRGHHQCLGEGRLLDRVAMRQPDAHDLAVIVEHVEQRVVGLLWHRQSHQLRERVLVVERVVQQPRRLGQEALLLRRPPPAADVEERADRPARLAVVVEQRRGELEQRDAGAVRANDVDVDRAHRQPGAGGALQRQFLVGNGRAIGRGDPQRKPLRQRRGLRDVLTRRDAEHLGEGAVRDDAPAVDVLGDADADWRLLEERREVAGPALRVAGQPIDRLARRHQLVGSARRLGRGGVGLAAGARQPAGDHGQPEADDAVEHQAGEFGGETRRRHMGVHDGDLASDRAQSGGQDGRPLAGHDRRRQHRRQEQRVRQAADVERSLQHFADDGGEGDGGHRHAAAAQRRHGRTRESGRRADPGQSLVVGHAHHRAAAHADERQHRPQAVGPQAHDANLGLGGAVRRLDHRRERDPFLQQVEGAVGDRDRGEVGLGRREPDAAAGEGEQRLQHQGRRIGGERVDRVEPPGARHRRMAQPRNRRLAEPEVPGRMADPLHRQVVAVVERHRMAGALELVGNDAVEDAADRHLAPAGVADQRAAAHGDVLRIDGRDAPELLGEHEVGLRLLALGRDLHQHDFRRVVPADQHLAHQRQVGGRVEAAHVRGERRRQVVDRAMGFGQHVLEGVERREGLELDQLRACSRRRAGAPGRSRPGRRSAGLPVRVRGSARESALRPRRAASSSARKPVTSVAAVAASSSSSASGKKHGVSLTGKGSGRPVRSLSRCCSRT